MIAGLNVDLAIVIKDRDQLLAEKYKALALGLDLREFYAPKPSKARDVQIH